MATLAFMNHTIFYHGAGRQLAKVLGQQGIHRPLLRTDLGLVDLGMVAELAGRLASRYLGPEKEWRAHLQPIGKTVRYWQKQL